MVEGTVSVVVTGNGEGEMKKEEGYLRIILSPSKLFSQALIERTSGEVV
jgi:hypothetical protein